MSGLILIVSHCLLSVDELRTSLHNNGICASIESAFQRLITITDVVPCPHLVDNLAYRYKFSYGCTIPGFVSLPQEALSFLVELVAIIQFEIQHFGYTTCDSTDCNLNGLAPCFEEDFDETYYQAMIPLMYVDFVINFINEYCGCDLAFDLVLSDDIPQHVKSALFTSQILLEHRSRYGY